MPKFAITFMILFGYCNSIGQSCTNWLSTPSNWSAVQAGDLDIPGKQITVEAMFIRTEPYSGGRLWAGDLVSKHDNPRDVNYLLRPNSAEITTTSGYFVTPEICEIILYKTYHVAMTYDGRTLKFYRNGILMSQTLASGYLIQNDWPLRIGAYFSKYHNTSFIGYIDEVRIWNVVRTPTQIRTYVKTSLPNPTKQVGLLAYYTFDDLTNKQGNKTWNGNLDGKAAIKKTNPVCNICPDSCGVAPGQKIAPAIKKSLTTHKIRPGGAATLTISAK